MKLIKAMQNLTPNSKTRKYLEFSEYIFPNQVFLSLMTKRGLNSTRNFYIQTKNYSEFLCFFEPSLIANVRKNYFFLSFFEFSLFFRAAFDNECSFQ